MKMVFSFYDNEKKCHVPFKRQFTVKVIEFDADKSFFKGEVIEKNEWAIPEIGTVDIFITKYFEEI